jgi:isopenicillin N synthase-like dioxygenase
MVEAIPEVNIAPYLADPTSANTVIQNIYDAASNWGFFILSGTHVSPNQQNALVKSAKQFFSLPMDTKMAYDVSNGGVAWRGYMPLGGENTHGRRDWKEGLYIGPEQDDDHRLSGKPLHGRNQYPDDILPDMRHNILTYVEQVSDLGKILTDILSLSLGLERNELRCTWLEPEPIVLFRCFKYPPISAEKVDSAEYQHASHSFGIGKHTDFGYLTILKADSPGLQVRSSYTSEDWKGINRLPGPLAI